jgi:predicted RNA-binding protein with PUA-like domain
MQNDKAYVAWLAKSEPEAFSFDDLVREKKSVWDGVRNAEARKNLRNMKLGDRVLIYHSGKEPAIVGIAEVVREAYPEPNAEEWVVVELSPVRKLRRNIYLRELKALPTLKDFVLVRRGRLSVLPITREQSQIIFGLERTSEKATAVAT